MEPTAHPDIIRQHIKDNQKYAGISEVVHKLGLAKSIYGAIIWIEGIIGAGKSTLTEMLSEVLNLRPIYEPVDSNPYLDRFYKDQARWAFPMQIELLHRRFAMQKLAAYEATMCGGYSGAILDRGMPGDRVFAKMLMMNGKMDELEWKTYERAYDVMTCSLIPPSMLIFLDVEPETAMERIRKRNRPAEAGIDLPYLKGLRKGYMDLIVEIQSGEHAWSRGMEVRRIPWNVDHQPIEKILEMLLHKYYV
jgi:deoxyadenosine/deoxycytidine kinase